MSTSQTDYVLPLEHWTKCSHAVLLMPKGKHFFNIRIKVFLKHCFCFQLPSRKFQFSLWHDLKECDVHGSQLKAPRIRRGRHFIEGNFFLFFLLYDGFFLKNLVRRFRAYVNATHVRPPLHYFSAWQIILNGILNTVLWLKTCDLRFIKCHYNKLHQPVTYRHTL